jgi:hypothetical protein
MAIVNLPGFTAECSVFPHRAYYQLGAMGARLRQGPQIVPAMKTRCYWDSDELYCCDYEDSHGYGGCCSFPGSPSQGIHCVYNTWGST